MDRRRCYDLTEQIFVAATTESTTSLCVSLRFVARSAMHLYRKAMSQFLVHELEKKSAQAKTRAHPLQQALTQAQKQAKVQTQRQVKVLAQRQAKVQAQQQAQRQVHPHW